MSKVKTSRVNDHELTSCKLVSTTLDGYFEKTIHSTKF